MPRENRKRGKKHKKKPEVPQEKSYTCRDVDKNPCYDELELESDTTPSKNALDAPFGLLDPDLKAYFKTVNDQLKAWQDKEIVDVDRDVDPNEERRMFLTAALSEMRGKELQLVSDPECSPILERMLYSMDDFVRRVFADSLAGSWLPLIMNRFASHVCQTLFTLAGATVGRESRGVLPPCPDAPEKGELPTLTQLILDACDDILTELPTILRDSFGSHVLRTLLILLAPKKVSSSLDTRSQRHAPAASSKKSASWKARQGPMKAILLDQFLTFANVPEDEIAEFSTMAKKFLDKFRNIFDGNEVRALAMDKVASPVLQIFIHLEAALNESDRPNSLMDDLLVGLISASDTSNTEMNKPDSSFVSALLVDVTSSHVSESILSQASHGTFSRIWQRWIVRDLPKLATHRVANFVVAKGILRLGKDELSDAINRLEGVWKKILRFSCFGVLLSVIERCGQLACQENVIIETICSLYEIKSEEDRKSFVPCILQLQTLTEYNKTRIQGNSERQASDPSILTESERKNVTDSLKHTTQGSLILQSILRMREPYINIVLDSLHSLAVDDLLALACNPTSSRMFDTIFESPTVPLHSQKKVATSFLGQFHRLVDDRIGSRVADRFWDAADPYLKEKIARSLLPYEQSLAGSHFGRFFSRNLGLALLKQNSAQWKAMRSKQYKPATSANAIPTIPEHDVNTKTRKRKPAIDEIDALFAGLSKKVKVVASLEPVNTLRTNSKSSSKELRSGSRGQQQVAHLQ